MRLWATWGGRWPAAVRWSGVGAADGLTAEWIPAAPGDATVRAGEQTLTLRVQSAANAGGHPIRPVALPLYAVEADGCRDDRYPALAGAWVVWCTGGGLVDRALSLSTRAKVSLRDPGPSPGLGEGVLYDARRGLWRLPEAAPDTSVPRAAEAPPGAPATDGTHGAFAARDHVAAFTLSDTRRTHTEARPLLGAPLALAWPFTAWIQQDPLTGEDVWLRGADGRARPLARNPGDERNVAGDGRWLAWTAADAVYVEDLDRRERRRYPAETGFHGGLGMWGPVACWEDRAGADVDIRCSDGVEIRRPGDQLHPSRHGPWLLFREGDLVFLATASELILDDDDPRASDAGATVSGGYRGAHRDAPVTYALRWPVGGWRVERWLDGGWVPGEALGTGDVRVEHPGGDAIRLVAP